MVYHYVSNVYQLLQQQLSSISVLFFLNEEILIIKDKFLYFHPEIPFIFIIFERNIPGWVPGSDVSGGGGWGRWQ